MTYRAGLHSYTVLLALAAASSGFAQTVEPTASASDVGAGTGIDEIVVTARKVEENIQTVPISVTALTAENLLRQSVRSLDDITSQTPNLYMQRVGIEPQSLVVAMRGQYQNDIPLTADPSVGIYVDGLYHPRTIGMAGVLVDLQRVEVLRGPQGTLFGRNTTGGALNILTADPVQEFEGSVGLTLGNYDWREVVGVVNVPFSETLAGRFVVQRGVRDGYATDALGRDLNQDDSLYARGKLLFTPYDGMSIKLFGNFTRNDAGGGIIRLAGLTDGSRCGPGLPPVDGCTVTVQTTAQLGLPFTAGGFGSAVDYLRGYVNRDIYDNDGTSLIRSDFEGEEVGLDIKIDLNDDIAVRSITGYQGIDRDNIIDSDGTPIDIIGARFTTRSHYVSQELQLLGGDETINWVVGAYFGHESGDESIDINALPLINPANPAFIRGAVTNENYAGFAQANWQFVPQWRVTAGLRYSRDEREVSVNNGNVAVPCVVPAAGVAVTPPGAAECPRTFEAEFSDPSWLISLDHEFTDDIFGYVKASHGIRSGGLNFRGGNNAETFNPYDPEEVTEYEVGVKTTLFDRRVHFNLAAYYSDYTGIQRSISIGTSSGTPTNLVANAASASVDGFEVELNTLVTERFSVNATVGYTHGKYDNFVDLNGDRSKEKFAVPEWLGSLSGRYEIPVGFGQISAQLDYAYQSEVVLAPDALDLAAVTQDGYGLFNARLATQIESIDTEIALFGRNLADKHYKASAVTNEASVGFSFVTAGVPRVWGAQLTKRF